MKISIIGTGYIWLIQALWLAKLGFEITSIDVSQEKIDTLKAWIPTIYEDGLPELLKEYHQSIDFTTDMSHIVWSDVIFICVGTPQDDEGKTDLGYIFGACNDIKPHLSGSEIVVIKSTVPVWTNARIYESLERKNTVVSNPEFLREGLAIKDFFNPDRIVLGVLDAENKKVLDTLKKVYASFAEKNIPTLITDWQTAELIKYAANSFLATKITFVNEISRLADRVWANVKDISLAIGMDDRIGPKFLNAGIGYGWSCFPKDVKSLIHQFQENGLSGEIVSKVDEINDSQVNYFMSKILDFYGNDLHGKVISVLWVAFKPDTDDLRESKGIEVIKKLMHAGARLKIYDYNKHALLNFRKYLDGIILWSSRWFFSVKIVDSFDELITDSDSLVVTLEDKRLLNENFQNVWLRDNVIFDGRNILNKKEIQANWIIYFGVGVQ